VEDGEARERTAVREVREEAGIDAELVGPLDTIEYWFKSTYDPVPARVHKFVHFFLLRYVGGSTDDHDDEVSDARWVDIGEAQALLSFKDERRIVRMAEEALRRVAAETDQR
jgi:8-oxo-dGTP pyrophosphatase MutT (NUDIX family)